MKNREKTESKANAKYKDQAWPSIWFCKTRCWWKCGGGEIDKWAGRSGKVRGFFFLLQTVLAYVGSFMRWVRGWSTSATQLPLEANDWTVTDYIMGLWIYYGLTFLFVDPWSQFAAVGLEPVKWERWWMDGIETLCSLVGSQMDNP